MAKFEFIVIGIGLNEGGVTKGTVCESQDPETCTKGAPSFRFDDNPEYAHDGYKKIQGPGNPAVLGGAQFNTEAEADRWLAGVDGKKFKRVFLNVFLTRVIAK